MVQIDPVADPRWERLVENHPAAWLTHTSQWAAILQRSFPYLRPCYLALEDADGELRAALPLMELSSPWFGKKLISLPYSTLCDPLVRNLAELELLVHAATELREAAGADVVEIRSSTTGRLLETLGTLGTRHDFVRHRLPLRRPLAEVKQGFSRHAVRPCIHKSQRFGLEVRPVQIEDFPSFWSLYVETRSRLGLPVFPQSFLRAWLEELLPVGRLWGCVVSWEGRPASVLLALTYKGRMSAEVIGWETAVAHCCPNHRAFWAAICHAHASNFEEFDFGRTPVTETRLIDFKKRWGTICESLTSAFSPACAAEQSTRNGVVARLASRICRCTPTRVLPLLSRSIYRHFG